MQNYQCRGKSYQPSRREADNSYNSYRDIDNFAYHKKLLYIVSRENKHVNERIYLFGK